MKKTKVAKTVAPKKKGAPTKAKGKAKAKPDAAKAKTIKGVPSGMTLAKAAKWAAPRISKKRFQHVTGVVEVGLKLAKLAKLSPADRLLVGLACWLHDSCKEMKDYELIEKARAAGMKLTEIEKNNGHLLHGPVAALLVRKELKISNKTVLNAIAEHTLGATSMTEVSKLVFLADCLEASRPTEFTAPIWEALAANQNTGLKSKINLDNALLVACDLSLAHLLEARRPIHPKTVDVRNHFLGIVRAAEKLGS